MSTIEELNYISEKVCCKLKEKTPEILLGASMALTVAAVGTSIGGSFKTANDVSDYEDRLKALRAQIDDEKELAVEIKFEKKQLVKKVIKHYIPAFVCTAGSLLTNYGDHHVLKQENKKLMTALTALNAFTAAYRKRVIDELGEEADFRFATGTSKKAEKVEVENPDGTKETVTLPKIEQWDETMYTRKWSASKRWEFNPDYNVCTLSSLHKDVIKECRNKGFVWFNDILKMYGYGVCSYGHDWGYIYDPDKPIMIRHKEVVIRDEETGRWAKDYIIFFDGLEYIRDKVYKERKGLITSEVLLDGEDPDNPPF